MRFTRFATAHMVDDIAATRDFLVDHLGCTVAVDLGWYVDLLHPADPAFMLDLVQRGHESMPEGLRDEAVAGVAVVFVVEDARAECERLRAAGAPVLAECRDEPWGQRHFFVRSPGPVIEVVQMIEPDAAWMAANGLA